MIGTSVQSQNLQNTDIGEVGITGSATPKNEKWEITATGADVWNNKDQFHYLFTNLNGDGEISVKIESLDSIHEYTKAGVMIRENLTDSSAHCLLTLHAGSNSGLQYRKKTSEITHNINGPVFKAPAWLKITRKNNVFTGYISTNGINWQLIDSVKLNLRYQSHIGFYLCSHNNTTPVNAVISNLVIDNGDVPPISPPRTPSGFQVKITNSGAPGLVWNNNSDNEFGYIIERKDNETGAFSEIQINYRNDTAFIDREASANTKYFYRICAYNSLDTSAYTAIISIETPLLVNKTYHVSPLGNDNNTGLTPSDAWLTIDYAVSKNSPVQAGDTILVHEGEYISPKITFEKSGTATHCISLKANGEVIIKDANYDNTTTFEGLFHLWQKKHWIIDGFRIEDAHFFGIGMFGCTDITVKNCYTKTSGASGISAFPYLMAHPHPVPQSWDISIMHCTVEEANWKNTGNGVPLQEGISVAGVDGFEVAYCHVFHSTKEGIDIKSGSRNGSVHHCVIHDQNHTGIYHYGGNGIYIDAWMYETYNIDIYNNFVYSSNTDNDMSGIPAGSEAGGDLKNVRIFNNVMYNLGQSAIGMPNYENTDSIYNIFYYNNVIYNCRWPARLPDDIRTSKIVFANNIIYGNKNDMEIPNTINVTFANNIIDQNPQWLNPANGSFLLKSGSPAIDAGKPIIGSDTLWFPGYDLLDSIRIRGNAIDCGPFEFNPDIIYPQSIQLSQNSLQLSAGENSVLKTEITPINATDKTVHWFSTAPGAIAVEDGKVEVLNNTEWGYVVAVSNTGAFTDSCIVNAIFAESINIQNDEIQLDRLHYYTLKAEILPANAINKEVIWESTNTSVVKHLRNGQIKAVNDGIAYVCAKIADTDLTDSVKVIVGDPQHIRGIADKPEIMIFPNPVTNKTLTIKYATVHNKKLNISIYDISGKSLFFKEITKSYNAENTIKIPNLHQGIYILIINTANKTFYHKIISQ